MSYPALLSYAANRLRLLLSADRPTDPQARYIHDQIALLPELPVLPPPVVSPALDFIELCLDSYPALDGSGPGDQHMRRRPGLWRRLMHEWPMGDYAQMAVQVLREERSLVWSRPILEVGAGVGNATVLIRDEVGAGYVRADLHPELPAGVPAPGRVVGWDFDQAPPAELATERFEVIFAVNALHCSADPEAAVQRLGDLLLPGGLLLLAEGQPWTQPGIPWALNAPFGLLDGWWDRGGFRSREDWMRYMRNFGTVKSLSLTDSGHDLGGVVWVRKTHGITW